MAADVFDENDEVLVAAAQQEPHAFAQLYKKYYEKVYRYCYYRLNRRKEITEDIVAEVFLKALEHINDYKYRGVPFVVWLYRIARNLIIDYGKRALNLERPGCEKIDGSPSGEDAVKNLETRDLAERIVAAIEALPEDQQEIVTLRYVSGLSFKEIGKVVGLAENATKMRYYRAIKRIKKMVEDPGFKTRTKNKGLLDKLGVAKQP